MGIEHWALECGNVALNRFAFGLVSVAGAASIQASLDKPNSCPATPFYWQEAEVEDGRRNDDGTDVFVPVGIEVRVDAFQQFAHKRQLGGAGRNGGKQVQYTGVEERHDPNTVSDEARLT